MNSGSEPITSAAATMRPHSAIVAGFSHTVLMEVATAAAGPMSRSSSSGNDTTLMLSETTAKPKPIRHPAMISVQPRCVATTSLRKSG